MKNLLFAIAAMTLVALFQSCKSKPARNLPVAATDSSTGQTLNDYAEAKAKTMVSNFERSFTDLNKVVPSRFLPPSSLYAFYNIDEITKMNNLLGKEMARTDIKIDGVRIYLGTKEVYNRPNVEPEYHLFLVTTTGGGVGTHHTNYYNYVSPYPKISGFGDAQPDNEQTGASQGGRMFGNDPGPDVCNTPGYYRWVRNEDAFKFVQRRCKYKAQTLPSSPQNWDSSGYNTRAAWFDICFVKALLQTIIDKGFTGLRIYQAKGYINPKHPADGLRDFFLLIPTIKGPAKNSNLDYYPCIHNASDYFKGCPGFPIVRSGFAPDSSTKADLKRISEVGLFVFGGYDKGELCPYTCD